MDPVVARVRKWTRKMRRRSSSRTVATAGFQRDCRVRRQSGQELAVKLAIVRHPERLSGLSFFIHRKEHGELLVCVTSDKLFHIAAAPPSLGVLLAVYATPLQRFHSIIIGHCSANATSATSPFSVEVDEATLHKGSFVQFQKFWSDHNLVIA